MIVSFMVITSVIYWLVSIFSSSMLKTLAVSGLIALNQGRLYYRLVTLHSIFIVSQHLLSNFEYIRILLANLSWLD